MLLKKYSMENLLKLAKSQTVIAASLSTKEKNNALNVMADELILKTDEILSANEIDVKEATFLSSVMVDRLKLTAERIKGMADGMREVALLPDPVGRVLASHVNKAGLNITKMSVPFGVVAVILALRNMISLPVLVGLDLQSTGEFSIQLVREVAVLGPMAITAICLLLMFCSKRTLTPWLVSVFSLALPLLILFTNTFPQ